MSRPRKRHRCDVCHAERCDAPACHIARARRYIRALIRAYRNGELPLAWVRENVLATRAEMIALRGAA